MRQFAGGYRWTAAADRKPRHSALAIWGGGSGGEGQRWGGPWDFDRIPLGRGTCDLFCVGAPGCTTVLGLV